MSNENVTTTTMNNQTIDTTASTASTAKVTKSKGKGKGKAETKVDETKAERLSAEEKLIAKVMEENQIIAAGPAATFVDNAYASLVAGGTSDAITAVFAAERLLSARRAALKDARLMAVLTKLNASRK
jgi:hypothetical protein